MSCLVAGCGRQVVNSEPRLCWAHYRRHRNGGVRGWIPIRRGGHFFQARLSFGPLRAQRATISGLAESIGVSRRNVIRWKHSGVPVNAAESACDALGLHPCEVWGDEYLYAASCPVAALTAALQVGP